jgi:ATP-dependent Clp protease adapter protein ClpS
VDEREVHAVGVAVSVAVLERKTVEERCRVVEKVGRENGSKLKLTAGEARAIRMLQEN